MPPKSFKIQNKFAFFHTQIQSLLISDTCIILLTLHNYI